MAAIESLESMLVWMRERPRSYCSTAGELDSVLWYLHKTWAKFVERETELESTVREFLGDRDVAGLLDDDERHERIDAGGRHVQRVVDFWTHVDERLGCRVRTDQW